MSGYNNGGISEEERHVRVLEAWYEQDVAWIGEELSGLSDRIGDLTRRIEAQQQASETLIAHQANLLQAFSALAGLAPPGAARKAAAKRKTAAKRRSHATGRKRRS